MASPTDVEPALRPRHDVAGRWADLARLLTAYARDGRVTSVAVVGNAPMAPDAERAAAVDGADLVLRVNSFVTDRPGDAPTQGRRTDVVVWNRINRATEFVYAGYRERLYLLAEPMRLHGFPEMWPSSWPADLGLVPVPNTLVADLNDRLHDGLGRDWRAERLAPTTGTLACEIALQAFPEAEVRLTGFSFLADPDQTEWEHQWGDSCPVGREHRIDAEGAYLRAWVATERVVFLD